MFTRRCVFSFVAPCGAHTQTDLPSCETVTFVATLLIRSGKELAEINRPGTSGSS